MCGFAGGSFSDITTLKSISGSLLRRAKQEPVYYVDSNVSLFHAPLQISDLDLDTNQPYLSSRVVISLVGELYNKEYLLRKIGLSESTQITEVALIEKCYLALGVKFIDYLNGEFVIYLFDKLEAKHYLFRDRYGVHSVYYTTREGKLYFSSHMQDLLSVSSVDNSKINKSGLLEYYTFQFSISPHTVFSDIYIVAPGTFLEFHNGEYKIEKFSEYIPQSKNSNFIDVFEESVIRRIPLHQKKLFIPISGGKDSNLVLYFLQKHFKGEIIPYSFLNTENYMDIESAQKNIKKYGFKHLIIENSEIEQEHFYDNVKLHEGLVKLYNMSGKLRELYPEYDDVHVEFSGDGREELFRVNNHFNCERIKKRYHLLKGRGLISDYNISNDFLNISMFDFNLQLIEKITLGNLIERRLPFTDYELLKFSGSTLYSKEAEKFLKNKGMNIVDGVYGHNTGIYFKYLDNMKEILSYLDTFNYNTSSYDIHKK